MRPDERRAEVLLGPRQIGKTTLLKQLGDDLLAGGWPPLNLTYFDFEDFRLKRPVEPEEIAGLSPPGADPDHPRILLLDELQAVDRWDRWLKHAVDERLGRIVATGSSASVLRQGGRESGLGRWDEIVLDGLSLREFVALNERGAVGGDGDRAAPRRAEPHGSFADPATVERYLSLGGFPEYARDDDYPLVRERLRGDVVDRALRRDLAGRVDDPERLRRLFVYLVQGSGGEQNFSDRATDLAVDPRTVAKWVDLLEDTLLIAPLRRGSTSAKASARLRGRPKLYAADHGLVNAFAEAPPTAGEVRGRVFEAVVFRHLREVARERSGDLHYLKWGNDLEVDFVLESGGERVAVEVTQSVQPKSGKRRALARAADRAGARHALLVHGGMAEGEEEGVTLLPLNRFLWDPESALGGGGG